MNLRPVNTSVKINYIRTVLFAFELNHAQFAKHTWSRTNTKLFQAAECVGIDFKLSQKQRYLKLQLCRQETR
jgi:hypothetical protein